MRRLLVRSLWRLIGRRLGWLAVGSAARVVLKRGASDRVDRAATELGDRLPPTVRAAVETLPGDPLRVGGTAVVAGRSARQAAAGAAEVSRVAGAGRRRVAEGVGMVSDAIEARPRPVRSGRLLSDRFGQEVAEESERARRRLRSRMLRHLGDDTGADDALLDLRPGPADDPWVPPDPPPPVRSGRFRRRRQVEPPVARVQRTYHRPRRPWDR